MKRKWGEWGKEGVKKIRKRRVRKDNIEMKKRKWIIKKMKRRRGL